MEWKNQFTKTPYLVLFIILIAVGVGTASALITITFEGLTIFKENAQFDKDVNIDGIVTGQAITDFQNQIDNNEAQITKLQLSASNSRVPTGTIITPIDLAGTVPIGLTIGADDLPIIVYQEDPGFSTGDFMLVHCTSYDCSSFETPISLDTSSGGPGSFSSIAIGTDNFPIISYQDESDKLQVIHCTTMNCSSFSSNPIDPTIDVIQNSIVIGSDGLPFIFYKDSTNQRLKFVKCGNIDCTSGNSITTAGAGKPFGLLSAAISVNGLPIVTYRDNNPTPPELVFGICDDISCTGFTAAAQDSTSPGVAFYTSLTVGPDGFAVMSYEDTNSAGLKVAKCDNQFCAFTTTFVIVDSVGLTGDFNSITIGNDGFPMVSYFDFTNGDLKFVKCGDPGCTTNNVIQTVDDAAPASVGWYSSLALGIDGNPIIAYVDSSNSQLKVAKCGNPFCIDNWTRR